jgi:hypothetical protein
MKIDPNMSAPNVEVVADVLEISEMSLEGIAEALAADLRAAVASQPGDKWNRTGKLLRSISSSDDAVTLSSDRLERDPELADKFAADVMPSDPLDSARVRKAAEDAVMAAVKVEK